MNPKNVDSPVNFSSLTVEAGRIVARLQNDLFLANQEIARLNELLSGLGYRPRENKSVFGLLEVD